MDNSMTRKEQPSSDITKLSSNELSNKGFDSTFPRTDTVIQSNTRSTNHEKSNRNSVTSTKSYLSECSSQSKTGKIMTAFEKMMTSGNTRKILTTRPLSAGYNLNDKSILHERRKISQDIAPWNDDETRITKNDSSMNGQYPVKSSFFGEGSSNMKQRIDQSSKNEYTGKTLVRSNLSVSSLNTFDAIPDIPTTTGTDAIFTKNYKKGCIYSGILIFNEKKEFMLNKRGMIPTLCLYGMKDESGELFERFNQNNDAFLWAKQTSLDWEPGVCDVFDISNPFSFTSKSLIDRCAEIEEQSITVTKFRKSFYESVACFLDNFKLRHFGVMEKQPIVLINEGCIMILNIAMFMKSQVSTEGMKLTGFSWSPSKSLNSHVYFSAMNPVWTEYESIAHEPNQILKPGLYLCHYVIFVTLEGPMILAQREYPNLPPLLKLRDKFEVDELEHEILSSALEDDSLSSLNPFTASIIKTFPKFERSIQIPLHFKKLMSITPTKLDNNASILILVNVIDLGQKKPYYDESMFKLLPLQLFEMIHFSSYTQEIYSHHFRKLRLMKIKMSRLVKHGECKMKGEMMNDIKDANKRFNESKWTRQGLSLVTLRIEGVDHGPLKGVVMKDEEARLKKEISPWT